MIKYYKDFVQKIAEDITGSEIWLNLPEAEKNQKIEITHSLIRSIFEEIKNVDGNFENTIKEKMTKIHDIPKDIWSRCAPKDFYRIAFKTMLDEIYFDPIKHISINELKFGNVELIEHLKKKIEKIRGEFQNKFKGKSQDENLGKAINKINSIEETVFFMEKEQSGLSSDIKESMLQELNEKLNIYL